MRKVCFELDETFGTIHNDKKQAPFELSRIGWGTFNIPISVFFRRETGIKDVIELNHELSFEGNGKK